MKGDKDFDRFLESARRGRAPGDVEPSFGFSARVASRALATEREEPLLLWERLALKGLATALVLALCVGTGVIRVKSSRPSALADFAGMSESQENFW